MLIKVLLIAFFDAFCSKAAANCINSTSFNTYQLEYDIKTQLIDASATQQAQVLYESLSKKYCWLYWLVLVVHSARAPAEWDQSDWSFYYHHNRGATSALGAIFLNQPSVNNSFVHVVWSNSIAPWSRWRFFREDFVDALFNPSDKNIRRLCSDNDNWWPCRAYKCWSWGWHGYTVPFQHVFTLRNDSDIALRYTDGFAFVYRGRTYTREPSDASLAPSGVDLSGFEAILTSTMTNCLYGDEHKVEFCELPSWNRENVTNKQVRTFSCTGFECSGTARKVNANGEVMTPALGISSVTSAFTI